LDHRYGDVIDALLKEVLPLAKPRSFYLEAPLEITDDAIIIEDVPLSSKVLVRILAEKKVVYPYLATSGEELVQYASKLDTSGQFTLDAIMEALLRKAILALDATLTNALPQENMVASVNPGSLVDWPITQQQKLFEIFGDNSKKLGVRLNESSLMYPMKSLSGILYESDSEFHNCQLCQRQNCPRRNAPFDETLYATLLEE